MRSSPFYEPFGDSSINFWFEKICVFVSSNWGPLTVSFKQYPWNAPGQIRGEHAAEGDPRDPEDRDGEGPGRRGGPGAGSEEDRDSEVHADEGVGKGQMGSALMGSLSTNHVSFLTEELFGCSR